MPAILEPNHNSSHAEMDRNTLKTAQRGDSNSTEAVSALKAVHEMLNKFFSKSSLCEQHQEPTTIDINININTNTNTASTIAAQPLPAAQAKVINTNGTTDDKLKLAHQPKQDVNSFAADPNLDGSGSLSGTRANRATITTTNGAEGAQVPEPEQPDHQATNTTASEASKTGVVNGANGVNGVNGANGHPSTNRLRDLADEITRNIDAIGSGPGNPSEASARIKLTSAATELLGAVRPPPDTIMGWFAQMSIVSVVRVFQHWGVFEAIPAEKGASIATSELADKVGAEESLLSKFPSRPKSANPSY